MMENLINTVAACPSLLSFIIMPSGYYLVVQQCSSAGTKISVIISAALIVNGAGADVVVACSCGGRKPPAGTDGPTRFASNKT